MMLRLRSIKCAVKPVDERGHEFKHEASLQSARKPFKFVAEKSAASSSPKHRSPRVTSRDSTVEVEERLDAHRAVVACLYVAERFRSFLKRANARKPDWL